MEIFDTKSKDAVCQCMEMFHVLSVYDAINKRIIKFLQNIMSSTNALCEMCCEYAENEVRRP